MGEAGAPGQRPVLRHRDPQHLRALLFLLADTFGMFSIRLFGLASADGRKRLLCRTLTGALATVSTHRTSAPAGLQHRMRENHVLNAYLGQLDEAAARSDGNGIRDLADELATIPTATSGPAIAALHLDVVHRWPRRPWPASSIPWSPWRRPRRW